MLLLHGASSLFVFFYCSNQLREHARIHKCASLDCREEGAHCSHVHGLREVEEELAGDWRVVIWEKILFFLSGSYVFT